jgi:uncharacterized phage protein (TIGR02218 family)
MRDIPADLAGHLSGETTSLCHCWRATRRDGVKLGFTDHDEDLNFEDTVFHAGTGLDAAEASTGLGFAVGGGEVAGALSSDGLSEEDLSAGRWDGARVEMFLVNWTAPEQRIRLRVAEVGEVRRQGAEFSAELRSMMHRLDAKTGRLYAGTCDAELGDARCRKDLQSPIFTGQGLVLEAVSAFELVVSGLRDFADGWFAAGRLTWADGRNAGHTVHIRDHRRDGDLAWLGLWQAPPEPVSFGEGFQVQVGCDKRFTTCRERFANVLNFRGFPHMPGTERVLGYPSEEDGELDGGSYFL